MFQTNNTIPAAAALGRLGGAGQRIKLQEKTTSDHLPFSVHITVPAPCISYPDTYQGR